MALKAALVLDHRWCLEVLSGRKTWEIRSQDCRKRERIAIATSAATSPTGKAQILGEVDIIGSFKVADRAGDFFVPPPGAVKYIFLRRNFRYHKVGMRTFLKKFRGYKHVWAWQLANASLYSEPKLLKRPKGCINWVRLV